MRHIEFSQKVENLESITKLYGPFDLDIMTGRPTEQWERRNLRKLRLPFGLRHVHFPEFWLRRVLINKRASEALTGVLDQMAAQWTIEALSAHGLDQYVRCYAFGGGEPNLFWYGAAWELSPAVGGEILGEVIRIFSRHGWTYCGLNDKRRLRQFEFW
jgi:hypothetical protein